jgi:hypothetical protein
VSDHLFAVDPGLRKDRPNLGWALFQKKKLVQASVEKSVRELPWMGITCSAIIEAPRWYPREHRIDTNDLLDLSVLVGEIKGRFESFNALVELVYPRTWKGTVPKDIHNKRVLAALNSEELKVLPKRPRAKDVDHNLLDAVGIGLWKLGRMR